jgi:DNA polymerase
MLSAKIDITAIEALPLPSGDKKSQWAWLRDRVLNDPEVKSHVRAGVQPVFGVGNIDSPIFFCGEAPGAEEEQQGEPFVGRAGQLLTKIIEAMGVKRSDVYIANILNWRPEKDDMTSGNRPPTIQEMAKCIPFLKAQVNVIKPQVIVALGATACTGLLGEDPDRRMGDVRGKFFEFNGTPVMVTYHPSYLLRNNTNAAKRVVWEDFLLVMRRVGMPVTPAQEKYFL